MKKLLLAIVLILAISPLRARESSKEVSLKTKLYFSDGHVEEGLTMHKTQIKLIGFGMTSFKFKCNDDCDYREVAFDELNFAEVHTEKGGDVLFAFTYNYGYYKSKRRKTPKHKSIMIVKWMNESCFMGCTVPPNYSIRSGTFTQTSDSPFPIGFCQTGSDIGYIISEYNPSTSTHEYLSGASNKHLNKYYKDIREEAFQGCPEVLTALSEEIIDIRRPREFVKFYQDNCGSTLE